MKVLVGVDGGAQQPSALALAAQLAGGGELVVATVYPWESFTSPLGAAYAKTLEEAAQEVLASAGEQLDGVTFSTRAIGDLHTARALHDAAVEYDADAIVIGACHRGAVGRALLGGTGESVVHGSPRPVVVAPRDYTGDRELSTVGVAYDGKPESDLALTWAQRFAETTGASMRVMGVVSFFPALVYPGLALPPNEALIDELRAETQRKLVEAVDRLPESIDAEAVALDGAVVPTLVEAATSVDILVAGSRGYGPVGALLMGSISRALVHQAPCPVVVVPRSAEIPGTPAEATAR